MKIIFRDKEYLSFKQCFEDNLDIARVSMPTFVKRYRQGVPVEEALSTPKCYSKLGSHLVEGVTYPNLPSIARAYGMSDWAIYRRYFNGKRGDDLVPRKKRKDYVPPPPKKPAWEFEVGGVTYKNVKVACQALGIKIHTFKNRRKAGRTLEECLGIVPFVSRLTQKARTFEIDGEILTTSQIREKYGIYETTFVKRIERGMSPKVAATTKSRNKNSKLQPKQI